MKKIFLRSIGLLLLLSLVGIGKGYALKLSNDGKAAKLPGKQAVVGSISGNQAKVSIREMGVVQTKTVPLGKTTNFMGLQITAQNSGGALDVSVGRTLRPTLAQQAIYSLRGSSISNVKGTNKQLSVVQFSPYALDFAVGTGDSYRMGTVVMGRTLTLNGVTVRYLGSANNMAIVRLEPASAPASESGSKAAPGTTKR